MSTEKLQINPKMIEIGRISRGLSQVELAEKIGVEQGTLSKLETGLLNPKDDFFDKLCNVLNYPKSFFSENIIVLSPLLTHYRKRKSLTNFNLDFIEYNIYIRKHLIKKLLKSANIPNKLFHVSPDDHDPEDIARLVRQRWNIPRGPIKNLVALLESVGIVILQIVQNDEKLDGEMIPDENNLPVIYINKNLTGDRQRFTLAHELGHLIMHGGEYIPSIEFAEMEANYFASEFLMPADEIRYQLNEKMSFTQLADLKRYWKVSMAALVRRAKDLNVIDQSRYTSLNVQLSKAGYKKKEPEFDVFPDKPTIFNQLINIHLNELGYTMDELSNYLSINLNELREINDFYSDKIFRIVRS
jgi:Zn-dependent peptidase ImmA (M78 family)/transcriptional regulator with XRE-family HTH domain